MCFKCLPLFFRAVVVIGCFYLQNSTAIYGQPTEPRLYDPPQVAITNNGADTVVLIQMRAVAVVGGGQAMGEADALEYRKLKQRIKKTYPYAMNAVGLLKQVETLTAEMDNKRDQKKYLKKLEDQLRDEFQDEITKFTGNEGKVLIKIIERETQRPFFDILRELKNPMSVFFLNQLAKRYGYDLKEGYDPSKYTDMEEILQYIETHNGELDFEPTKFIQPKGFDKFKQAPDPNELLDKNSRTKSKDTTTTKIGNN